MNGTQRHIGADLTRLECADVETSSRDYARRFAGEVGEYFLELQTQTLLQLLAPWPHGHVLDVGGGHAQTAAPLARAGYTVTVTGTDEICRARLRESLAPGTFTFVAADMLRLPFLDRRFDAVIAFRLLPHVGQWTELIREMCRVARAAVIADYPDSCSVNVMQKSFFGWKKALERNTRPFRCFRRNELVDEFARHGFGRPAARPQLFLPMALHRAVGRARMSRIAETLASGAGVTRLFGSPVVLRVVRQS